MYNSSPARSIFHEATTSEWKSGSVRLNLTIGMHYFHARVENGVIRFQWAHEVDSRESLGQLAMSIAPSLQMPPNMVCNGR